MNGPLGGQEFDVDIQGGPMPESLLGSDLHPELCGTYELQRSAHRESRQSVPVYRYRLRQDDDYNRVYRGWAKQKVMREVGDLSEKFKE